MSRSTRPSRALDRLAPVGRSLEIAVRRAAAGPALACGLAILSACAQAPEGQRVEPSPTHSRPASSTSREQLSPAADHWDNVFRRMAGPESSEPSSFVAECAELLITRMLLPPRAKVLVLAMGDGRNAVLLAGKGLDVTGVDISPVAIEQAERAAAARGVAIRSIRSDLMTHDLGQGRWDLVTNVFFNPAIRVIDQIKAAVRPGGFLLVEGFSSAHRGPGPPYWSRYRPGQLVSELAGWQILRHDQGLLESAWAGNEAAAIERILARKPVDPDSAQPPR